MSRHSLIVFVLATGCCLPGCRTGEKAMAPADSGNILSASVSISPSAFRCRALILAPDSSSVVLTILQVLERGSSLVYPVASGDTLHCRTSSSATKLFPQGRTMELTIEERLKMNSEKPEFVIR